MTAAPKLSRITVEDYLAGELESEIKHEYIAGEVYAMAGAANVHNRIATNITGALHAALRGKPCEAFNSDTKVRIQFPTHIRFYYPDAMVVCQPNPDDESFQDQPTVIVEVVSPSTRRTDEVEKKEAYLTIPSLSAYLLVYPERVVVYRRTDAGFVEEAYAGDDVIELPQLEISLPVEDIYARVTRSDA